MSATRIPLVPLALGLAGLIPFVWGAATVLWPGLDTFDIGGLRAFVQVSGLELLRIYGLTILAFMSGVVWGFATRSPNPAAAWGYALSILPALWAFFVFLLPGQLGLLGLSLGFSVLLLLDLRAVRLAEAPHWWLKLRLLLTVVVVACLLVGTFA